MIQTQGLSFFVRGRLAAPFRRCSGLLADDDGAVDALDHAVHAGVDTGAETLFGNFTNDVAALDAIAGLHHGLGRGADVLPQRDAHFSRGDHPG